MSEIYRIASDGLILAAETFGEGQPLVFSHGLTNNRQQGRRQMAPLVGRCRLVTFDQRGHGGSTPVADPALYNAGRMAGDIAAVMDALGIGRALLVGESMGAATALLFALRWQERVEKLMLLAPAFGDTPNPTQARMRLLGRRLATSQGVEDYIAEARANDWRAAGFSATTMGYMAGYLRSHDPASIGLACESLADWILFRDLSVLATLSCPVQIVAWEGDPVHPVELAVRMAAAIPAASLVKVPSMATIFNDMPSAGRLFAEFLALNAAS